MVFIAGRPSRLWSTTTPAAFASPSTPFGRGGPHPGGTIVSSAAGRPQPAGGAMQENGRRLRYVSFLRAGAGTQACRRGSSFGGPLPSRSASPSPGRRPGGRDGRGGDALPRLPIWPPAGLHRPAQGRGGVPIAAAASSLRPAAKYAHAQQFEMTQAGGKVCTYAWFELTPPVLEDRRSSAPASSSSGRAHALLLEREWRRRRRGMSPSPSPCGRGLGLSCAAGRSSC